MSRIKTEQEAKYMKEGGKMLAQVLNILIERLTPGQSTKELALIAAKELKALGGEPAFLGYKGYPDVLCVSLNNEVVHGIPSSQRIIQDGDIVSLDFGVLYKGLITDAARSVIAGESVNKELQQFLDNTEKAMNLGIDEVRDGCKVGDISFVIQQELERNNLGVVRDLVGHGVGDALHEEPNIPNFGLQGQGPILRAGMTIAIEPMSTLGNWKVKVEPDGWTITTVDGSLSAHFENTVLVTEKGSEILTA